MRLTGTTCLLLATAHLLACASGPRMHVAPRSVPGDPVMQAPATPRVLEAAPPPEPAPTVEVAVERTVLRQPNADDPVEEGVRGALPDIMRCYKDELHSHPHLAGRITIEISVAANGTVSGANVLENTTNQAVADCAISTLLALRTAPLPSGEAVVWVAPLVFSPQN